jgi:O-antigen/teichoic acid export membrane protein
MLWIIIAQAGISTIASHWIAQRRYAWYWKSTYARRIVSFGWRVLINGLLMFGIFQGDRFIIGSADRIFHRAIYSLSDLGVYSVAFGLTMAPTLIIANIASALWLPLLSRANNDPAEFDRRYALCCQIVSMVGGGVALPLVMCGGLFVKVIYGQSYSSASHFIGWLAAMQAVRIIRVSPTLAAMSKGDTRNAMFSNVFRSSALGFAIIVAFYGGSLASISAAGFFGEVLALTASLSRLYRLQSVSPLLCLRPTAVTGLSLFIAAVLITTPIGLNPSLLTIACCLSMLGLVVLMYLLFPRLRNIIWDSYSDFSVWKKRIALKPFLARQQPVASGEVTKS